MTVPVCRNSLRSCRCQTSITFHPRKQKLADGEAPALAFGQEIANNRLGELMVASFCRIQAMAVDAASTPMKLSASR